MWNTNSQMDIICSLCWHTNTSLPTQSEKEFNRDKKRQTNNKKICDRI